jgi:hypothetical protein
VTRACTEGASQACTQRYVPKNVLLDACQSGSN